MPSIRRPAKVKIYRIMLETMVIANIASNGDSHNLLKTNLARMITDKYVAMYTYHGSAVIKANIVPEIIARINPDLSLVRSPQAANQTNTRSAAPFSSVTSRAIVVCRISKIIRIGIEAMTLIVIALVLGQAVQYPQI